MGSVGGRCAWAGGWAGACPRRAGSGVGAGVAGPRGVGGSGGWGDSGRECLAGAGDTGASGLGRRRTRARGGPARDPGGNCVTSLRRVSCRAMSTLCLQGAARPRCIKWRLKCRRMWLAYRKPGFRPGPTGGSLSGMLRLPLRAGWRIASTICPGPRARKGARRWAECKCGFAATTLGLYATCEGWRAGC